MFYDTLYFVVYQDLLVRHETTTHQMEDILSKFEGRLAKLENTITPVYTETATLQRRYNCICCSFSHSFCLHK